MCASGARGCQRVSLGCMPPAAPSHTGLLPLTSPHHLPLDHPPCRPHALPSVASAVPSLCASATESCGELLAKCIVCRGLWVGRVWDAQRHCSWTVCPSAATNSREGVHTTEQLASAVPSLHAVRWRRWGRRRASCACCAPMKRSLRSMPAVRSGQVAVFSLVLEWERWSLSRLGCKRHC